MAPIEVPAVGADVGVNTGGKVDNPARADDGGSAEEGGWLAFGIAVFFDGVSWIGSSRVRLRGFVEGIWPLNWVPLAYAGALAGGFQPGARRESKAGGDGNFEQGDGCFRGDGPRLGEMRSTGGAGPSSFFSGTKGALWKKSANRPSLACHWFHSSSETKRLYRTLLRNSTSMMWISCTEIPDTSAQVLLVYVLSSRTISRSAQHSGVPMDEEASKRTFVSQHKRDGHQPVFTTLLSPHARVELLQAINEEQCQ